MKTEIIYEDKDIIVCRKPAGFPVQSRRIGAMDMESELLNDLRQKNGERPYIGVIHRLDQPVEGLLVFARHPKAAAQLNRQLQQGGFGKYYVAQTEERAPAGEAALQNVGGPDASGAAAGGAPYADPCAPDGGAGFPDEGELIDYMVKDALSSMARLVPADQKGAKKAVLRYRTIRRTGTGRVLEIRLLTGRFHQIRAQLARRGMPIVGDAKYHPPCRTASGRQKIRLCAWKLKFRHPATGKLLEFAIVPDWYEEG